MKNKVFVKMYQDNMFVYLDVTSKSQSITIKFIDKKNAIKDAMVQLKHMIDFKDGHSAYDVCIINNKFGKKLCKLATKHKVKFEEINYNETMYIK